MASIDSQPPEPTAPSMTQRSISPTFVLFVDRNNAGYTPTEYAFLFGEDTNPGTRTDGAYPTGFLSVMRKPVGWLSIVPSAEVMEQTINDDESSGEPASPPE